MLQCVHRNVVVVVVVDDDDDDDGMIIYDGIICRLVHKLSASLQVTFGISYLFTITIRPHTFYFRLAPILQRAVILSVLNSALYESLTYLLICVVCVHVQVLRIPVQQCSSFTSCTDCLASHDPYCGWCTLESKYVTILLLRYILTAILSASLRIEPGLEK